MTLEHTPSAEQPAQVTASVVSHGHGAMVTALLEDLAINCGSDVRVVLTLNIPESLAIEGRIFPFPLTVIRNDVPKGFGANHNAAFRQTSSAYFCVLNPDIRLLGNPFPPLLEELRKPKVGVVAPRILNRDGNVEDSARRFPTLWFLVRKLFGLTHSLDYRIEGAPLSTDWVAGMFMLFRRDVFAKLPGFDERYFLYYEDVDLCRRLRKQGYDVRLVPSVSAVHDARRESRHNFRHLRWHIMSLIRYLTIR